MRDKSRGQLTLRGKLTFIFLGVGLMLASVNVVSTRWLQDRWEEAVARRADTVRLAEELTAVSNGAFEEGFGYVLSGDSSEKEACLRKLARFEGLRAELVSDPGLRGQESRVLLALNASSARAQQSAQRLFASYEAQGHADRQSFDAYEAAMDNLSEGVDKLATEIRHRSATDNIVARQRLDHVLLAVAAIAAALAITMGAIFGIRLTRPLVQLRDAAVRLGGGDFDFSADATSNDELGQLTREFAQMAQSIRRLLATVAEQKTRLENVFSSLAEMLLVCGPDGLILTANRAVCSTLGYREEELAGRALDSIIASAKFPELRETAGRHSVSGALHDRDGDQQLQKRDGSLLAVSLSVSVLQTAGHEDAGLICVAQDLSDRRRLEAELRQAQKLEAIGRLASGIAHEINTPTQFVGDSVHFAREATQDLLSLIEKYRSAREKLDANEEVKRAFAQAYAAEETADLPYLVERLPLALDRALEGLSRITAIVRSMKVFAHPDQQQMTPVDLNLAVESTLTVARNEYKYVAELETDFGQLPPVVCHAGEINQAVLNLVVNAAHAIADHAKEGARGLIRVKTRHDGASAIIAVSDSGGGIPEQIRERIFDPFFTTKEVGRGTGQGLSVARAVVVDKHRGQLSFVTEAGRGTTFEIRLPLV